MFNFEYNHQGLIGVWSSDHNNDLMTPLTVYRDQAQQGITITIINVNYSDTINVYQYIDLDIGLE